MHRVLLMPEILQVQLKSERMTALSDLFHEFLLQILNLRIYSRDRACGMLPTVLLRLVRECEKVREDVCLFMLRCPVFQRAWVRHSWWSKWI